MTRNTLLIDAGIAAVLAILVIVISPGLAVVGILALLVVIACGISFALDRRRHRAGRAPRSRPSRERRQAPPARRPPPRR